MNVPGVCVSCCPDPPKSMIASFFQSLDEAKVAYLLISGQATVLYGAATFSEDIDLWIDPSEGNRDSFLGALAAQGATYYKLTPPLELVYLRRGHGFHFVVPDDREFYLDVMGRPPRVPGFPIARAAATVMDTPWGRIPTIGIKHLVELKATQRLADYPVIGRLVLSHLQATGRPAPEDLRWALAHVFTLEDVTDLLRLYPQATAACPRVSPVRTLAEELAAQGSARPGTEEAVEQWLTERLQRCRRRDREYWRDIIDELREMRRAGLLMPVGERVKPRG